MAQPPNKNVDKKDAQIAVYVEQKLGMVLPPECTAGIAANIRLLQKHTEISQGKSHDSN